MEVNMENDKKIEDYVKLMECTDDGKENFSDCLGEVFNNELLSDDEDPGNKFYQIFNDYMKADENGKKLIDNVLISICGWSLLSLCERA
jgi:hypothetical protein